MNDTIAVEAEFDNTLTYGENKAQIKEKIGCHELNCCGSCGSSNTYLYGIIRNGNTGETKETYECKNCYKRTAIVR